MSRPRLFGVLPLVLAWLVSCSPAPSLPESSSGVMQLAVLLPAAAAPTDVARVTVTVSGPDMSPLTVQLAPADGAWGGVLGDLPAGPGRTFLAQAFNFANTLRYEGRADDVTVTAGATGLVSLTLQDVNPSTPLGNETPVVDALVATPTTVAPGASVSLTVSARDPNPGDTLSYAWSAPSGTLSAPTQASTSWTAPSAQGLVRLTLQVSDSRGAVLTTSLTVVVSAGRGAADVTVDFKNAFQVVGVTSSRSVLDVGQKTALMATVANPDGRVTYQWSATCAGTFSSTTSASPTFSPSARPTAACNNCQLTVTVTDGRGAQHQGGVALCVSGDTVPRGPGNWTPTGLLPAPRVEHEAVLLPSGQVLLVGSSTATNGVDVYDPATGTWSPTGSLNVERSKPMVASLSSGRVLAAGGSDGWKSVLATAEVYDPATGTWSPTGSLRAARVSGSAARLPTGKVLVSGGYGPTWNIVATAEVYDPATGTWSPTGAMNVERLNHTLTPLPDGRVLATGGATATRSRLAEAELYDPATGVWSRTGSMLLTRDGHQATPLTSGKVLVSGGNGDGPSTLMTAELYDPASGSWSFTGAMAAEHYEHTATRLTSGKVLVSGGTGTSGVAVIAELYDPATGAWSRTGSPLLPRFWHTATRLLSGQVLLVGGGTPRGTPSSDPSDTAEVYEPLP